MPIPISARTLRKAIGEADGRRRQANTKPPTTETKEEADTGTHPAQSVEPRAEKSVRGEV